MNEQTALLLGNVASGLGMLVLFVSTFLTDKRQILAIQSVNHVCSMAADLVLKGYSGFVQDVVSLLRNITVLAGRQTRLLKVLFVAAGLLFGVFFNNRGLAGLLPIVANTEYALVVVNEHASERALKWAIAASTLCWAVYSLFLLNFVNAAANFATLASALFSLWRRRSR